MAQKFWIDSDWDGDVFQLTSILRARPPEYEILGASVTFGNASHDQNLANAGAILRLLKMDNHVSVFPGSKAPLGQEAPPQGDGAHGTDGLGGVKLPLSNVEPESQDAADTIIKILEKEPANTVTLIATGPQTNIARAIQKAPEIMARVKEIRIMGGCLNAIPGYRLDENWQRVSQELIDRFGNITEHAEFNFQQDPHSAQIVLNSGLPIALFPMDCTHQTSFTLPRQRQIAVPFRDKYPLQGQIIGLIDAPRDMDGPKFASHSITHDLNTTVSIVRPDLYTGERGFVHINTDESSKQFGRTTFEPDPNGNIWAAQEIVDPDAVFTELVSSLTVVYAAELRQKAKPGIRA